MTTSLNTARLGRVDPGPGYGKQYNYTTDQQLIASQDGAVISNLGATSAISVTLPAAVAGMEFGFTRIASYPIRVVPSGTNSIGGGAPGDSKLIVARGLTSIACMVSGTWEVIIDSDPGLGYISVLDYGAVLDGTTDDGPALNRANDAAAEAKLPVFYPPGTYGLLTPVVVKAPMVCAGGGGPRSYYLNPEYGTKFVNLGITGGTTAMISVDSDTASPANETGRGFYIDGGFSIDGNISGSPSSCIGFYAPGTIGVNVLTRYSIERVWVTGCSIGIYIVGFTGTIKDCYAIQNTIGLLLDVANSVNVIGGEFAPIDSASSWAVRILSGSQINLIGINAENEDAGAVAIQGNGIDIAEGVKQVSIQSYLEDMAGNASTSGYHVRVGAIDSTGAAASNSLVNAAMGVSFQNTLSTASTAVAGTYGSLGPRIHLGNVIGVDLGTLAMTSKNLEVSQYAQNISGAVVSTHVGDGGVGDANRYAAELYVTDETKAMGRGARSFIPNPSGRGSSGAAIRGYRDIIKSSGITIASETSIVRADGHSIKITRAAAQTGTFSRAIFYPYGQDILLALQGTAVLTGWIYVPTAADGSPNDAFKKNGSSNLRYPVVGFECDTGSTTHFAYAMSGGAGASSIGYYGLGKWTRFFCFKPMADFGVITRLGWAVKPINDQAPVLSGAAQDHSVYVADVALCVSPQSWTDLLAGRFTLDPAAGTFIGDQFITSYTAAPTDANTYWKRGDIVLNSTPAVGSPDRWICTTAGVGGTATFTATANL